MRSSHRRPPPLAWRLHVRPSRDGRCLGPFLRGAAAVLLLLWIDQLSLAVAADHHAVVASSTKSCGRRFLVRDGETAAPDSAAAEGLLLSRGRGFMGAVMVDDPAVILFAGGIGRGGMVVDSNVDVFAVPLDVSEDDDDDNDDDNAAVGAVGGGGEEALVDRDVLSLGVARTDMGAGGTSSAVFFAGGCGMEDVGDDNQPETQSSGPTIVQGGGGEFGGGVAVEVPPGADPDVPLLLKNCQATDAVDVFLVGNGGGGGGDGAQGGKGKLSLLPPDAVRLCEPKYAATVGVFFTGSPDEGDPSAWAPTAHVLVAGGIIPTGGGEGGGQYTATSTVDIFRHDGIDEATGEAKVATLPVPRLPNPPRFEMTSCCFKHQCVFAGGRVSMGEGGAGFNSDRAEVWDGSTWSFATWGEHTLSEPRHLMGSAVIEISTGSEKRTVGMFAGGVSNTGDSSMVDLFDFDERRVLPRIDAPTVRGPTQGVSFSREVAAFVGATGKIDVFDGRTLCWISYEADGFFPGTTVVGRSPSWFFDSASPGF
ncbi:unnamed protein product, partial [Ectocarpus sp. 12 AP-2014]